MSADHWAICPRCLAAARAEEAAEREAVMALYGRVNVAEFDERRAALTPVEPEDFRTLREDYEFYGADKGEVCWSYDCVCTICGLGTQVSGSRRFWPEAAA